MEISSVSQHMENLMEAVSVVSLMDVLLASLSPKLTCKSILTEGTSPRNHLIAFTELPALWKTLHCCNYEG